ncbi:MAG: type II toxin-antitoxin system antitoxin SocA domain-containing protein [Elusimicrobiota bacterium]
MTMLAKFIQQLRKKRNLTQEYLASELGISRPTYFQIEQGGREPAISEARKLATIFNVSFENFLAGKAPEGKVILEKKPKGKSSGSLQIRVTSKNLEKFKQVLLYVLGKVGGKPNVGETVLHKLLYFIDFDYYEKFEENLMGATYIKNHHGPTSVELKAIVADMQKNGEIEAIKSRYFKYEQKKYLPLKRPNLDKFSAREIEHIDEVLARLADKNAKEIENYSHDDIPWKVAEEGQPLSYESVFYRDERYSVRNYDDEL